MKKIMTLIAALLTAISSFAQGRGINYKAVIKDDSGTILANQNLKVKFSILDSSDNPDYSETHTTTTDANGIVILIIGSGTENVTGDYFSINWASDLYKLKVEIDPAPYGVFVNMGTSTFEAVPYAYSSMDSVWQLIGDNAIAITEKVGIGTDVPLGKLGISHNSSVSDPQLFLQENDNDYARINFKSSSGVNYWSIAAYTASNHRNDRLNFSNGVGGDIMSLKGDGKIGFGVSNPKVKFHFAEDGGFLFGKDTIGPGSKIMYIPNKDAFRIGSISFGGTSNYWDDTSYFDRDLNEQIDFIGTFSFATGLNTRAQGYASTAMGNQTKASNSSAFATGSFSRAYGRYSTAMGFNTKASGTNSTAMGYQTSASGYASTAMGSDTRAGSAYETAIGRYTTNETPLDSLNWNANDRLFVIGNGTAPSLRNNAMVVLKNGKTGINTSTPASLFEVVHGNAPPTPSNLTNALSIRNSSGGSCQLYSQSNGSLTLYSNGSYRGYFHNTTGVYNSVSDRRLKKDITPLDNATLNKVMQLNPVSYLMKDQTDTKRNLGLISQEVQEIFPSLTHYVEESDLLTLSYTELIPILIKALQEQQAIIETQNSKLKTQDSKIENLTAEIGQFKTLELRVKQLESKLNTSEQ